MKRAFGAAVIAAILFGMWLGGRFGFGLPGLGPAGQGDGKARPAADASADPGDAGAAERPPQNPLVRDGALAVRIEGDRIVAGGVQRTVDEIARLAVEHGVKVTIERADDARARPREELERALREKNVHVVVQ
jgi:hypothetical protein